jgi:hypothetical protein
MNQEQILEELRTILANKQEYTTWTVSTPHLVALVNKFVQVEREECAKLCEPQEAHDDPLTAWKIAKAIRARGTT